MTTIVLVLVSGFGGVWAVHSSTSRVATLSRVLTPAVETHAEALHLMTDAEAGLRGFHSTGDETLLVPFARAREDVLHTLVVAEELGREAGVAADYAAPQVAAAAWLEEAHLAVGVEADSPDEAALAQSMSTFRAAHREVHDALVDRREVVRAETRTVRRLGIPALLAMTFTLVLVAAATARTTVRAVAGPLDALRSVLDRQRRGEHQARAQVSGPCEVSEVAAAVNALADESDRLRRRQDRAALLRVRTRDAARAVREPLDQDIVLRTAARVLGQLVGADRAVITHMPWATRSTASGPVHARWSADGGPLPGAPDLDRLTLRSLCSLVPDGEAMLVPTPGGEIPQAIAPLLPEPGARAVVARVGAADDSVAVVVLTVAADRNVSDDELHSVQLVCADLSRALEHSETYERQLELVDRLQELDRQKADFLSTVSHELRTPLTSIAGYTEMLREGVAGEIEPRARGMLDVVHRNVERLTRLIEDLLLLSRIEAGALRTEVADVDLTAAAEAVALALEPEARTRGLTLEVDGRDGHVRGDPGQLERVLLNLASNAVKFTPEGGSVRIEIRPSSSTGDVLLTVTDTGIGIPTQDMDKLTDRFFRASNAVDGVVPGTGLGLSIVRRVVEVHGGHMDVTSVQDEGTRVAITLPMAGPAALDEPGT
ncbi:ATP-binding protein [Cellulomonas bogoriensis]